MGIQSETRELATDLSNRVKKAAVVPYIKNRAAVDPNLPISQRWRMPLPALQRV